MATREGIEHNRHEELASFLRSRREKLRPEEVGLPITARRRTPGLRREEVAALLGISTTWYTWLEQGRAIQVSAEVVEQIARVFQLNGDECTYLYQLVQRTSPPPMLESSHTIPPLISDLLATLEPSPAHIRDFRWNVLAWNQAETFLINWPAYPPNERNIVWHHFMNPTFRRLLVHWERDARSLLSEFRMESAQHADDPWLKHLIGYLQQTSTEFGGWWPLHEVRRERELPLFLRHPHAGHRVFQPITLTFPTHPQYIMRVLIPVAQTDTSSTMNAAKNIPGKRK